jgi:hypothetical protein
MTMKKMAIITSGRSIDHSEIQRSWLPTLHHG